MSVSFSWSLVQEPDIAAGSALSNTPASLDDEGLETAVLLSLFTDRRADDGDVLPDAQTDRRGYWADAYPIVPGDLFGSRLWLLGRAKQTQETLSRIEEYTNECLAWLVEDRVASAVSASAVFTASGRVGLTVLITRPNVDVTKYQFNLSWDAQAARR